MLRALLGFLLLSQILPYLLRATKVTLTTDAGHSSVIEGQEFLDRKRLPLSELAPECFHVDIPEDFSREIPEHLFMSVFLSSFGFACMKHRAAYEVVGTADLPDGTTRMTIVISGARQPMNAMLLLKKNRRVTFVSSFPFSQGPSG